MPRDRPEADVEALSSSLLFDALHKFDDNAITLTTDGEHLMAKTLIEVRKQIADLKAIEDQLRKAEAEGVISRIREAIAVYGLTKQDLFGAGGSSGRSTSKAKNGRASSVMYSDGSGNTWSGRGRRPGWIAQALQAGKSLEDFSGTPSDAPAAGSTPPPAAPAKRKSKDVAGKSKAASAKKVAIKFRSGENTWSGRGSQPKWLKAALAEGRALSDFAV
jgi:DNA-binding protein H-NS